MEKISKKLVKINEELKEKNRCITIYDAYRPIQVQKIFWDYFFETHGYYDELMVANPNKYGTHNIKINAVDIFISNIDGSAVELPCEFDDFSGKSSINYNDCSDVAKENRDLLISTCKNNGLCVNEGEWWHFYDERIMNYGMRYNYIDTDLIPLKSEEVFIFEN